MAQAPSRCSSRRRRPLVVAADAAAWWRDAVVYQVYVRSFADGNGDGAGDLAGVRARPAVPARPRRRRALVQPVVPLAARRQRLRHRRLPPGRPGVRNAGRRGGADRGGARGRPPHDRRRRPEPRLERASVVSRGSSRPGRAHRHALDSGSGPVAARTVRSRRTAGARSSAARRGHVSPDGEWYLHLFAPEQPDLNWSNPDVLARALDVLRFWFDRGVAGVRIDSAALLVKDPELGEETPDAGPGEHPFMDRDELHDVYRGWRAIADGYDEPRLLVGEIWLPDAERLARYLRPDELHTAFNFDFLACPWDRGRLRATIDAALESHVPIDATPTWVLSNHDVTRPVTRYGRDDTSFSFEAKRAGTPTDLARGTRRARAAALLTMALPGSMYVYQGEELGLPEVEDIPAHLRRDPMHARSGGVDPGRDGCRVPIPWFGARPPYGFSPRGSRPPGSSSPTTGRRCTVEAQDADPASMLTPLPRRPAPPSRRPVGRRRRPALAARTRRRARVRPRRALRLRRQLRPRPVPAPARRRRADRQRRARRRCCPARHDGLVPPGRARPRQRQGKEGR